MGSYGLLILTLFLADGQFVVSTDILKSCPPQSVLDDLAELKRREAIADVKQGVNAQADCIQVIVENKITEYAA